jgi:neurofibromin 1
MSLVVGTCFQHNPATQPQAFIILGVLAIDEVDDDLIYQILVSLSTTLSHLSETDTTLLISMLRCLQALYAGLSSSRQYETSLFWLGFAVAEMGYIPLLGTALGLMYTALIHVKPEDHAGRCIENLLNFRRAMGDAAVKVDHMAGIRFDPEPSYGLVAILSKALRHPSTRGMAISLGLELLDMTTRESEHLGKDETALIPKDSVAYFVALLPVLSGNLEDRKRLFTKAGLLASEDPLRDLSSLSVLSLLSIPYAQSPLTCYQADVIAITPRQSS